MQRYAKVLSIALVSALVAVILPTANATVGVTVGPTNLVTDPIFVEASSAALALFSFTLGQDAGETLASVAVALNQNGTTTVSGADFANVSLYKDEGNGNFNSGSDTLIGTQAAVNVGANTVITPTASTTASGKFFVTLGTSASWSGVAPADSVKVTLPADQIISSTGALSFAAVTTASITADTSGPALDGALAKNTGGTGNKEAGDSVELVFSEGTNKPTINSGNINTVLALNNSHSWLSDGTLGAAVWNTQGTVLTITLGATTTVAVGDMVTIGGGTINDLAGNPAAGSRLIVGTFGGQPTDDDDDDDESDNRGRCANNLLNGRLYKVGDSATVYLAAACRLKPFRGAAVFKARGHKFQNIIHLASLPSDVTISQKPVLPAGGALIKGSDATVWFITSKGKRKGFTSANVFLGLGFMWKQIQQISDEDLGTIPTDSAISNIESHPEGALIKCGAQPTVYQVVGKGKFPFTSAEAFTGRGHDWGYIVILDCEKFQYIIGAEVKD